jgi:TadE-like protein
MRQGLRNSTTAVPHAARRGSRAPVRARIDRAAEDGQALVEFALLLPVLLLVLFGITQFGLALNSASDETHVANEVARYAAVNEEPPVTERLAAWGKGQIDSHALSNEHVCISFPVNPVTKTSGQIGDPVAVTVSGTFYWLPVPTLKGVANKVVEAQATMRIEVAPTIYGKECA